MATGRAARLTPMTSPIGIEYTRIAPAFEGGEGQRSLKIKRTHRSNQRRAGQSLALQAIEERGWTHTHQLERRDDHWRVISSDASAPLWLSISHSGPWVICAHDDDAPCAVDIECTTRDIDLEYACSHFMHPSTGAVIKDMPRDDKRRVFFMCWTMLESQGKLLGTALPQTLHRRIARAGQLHAQGPHTSGGAARPYAFFGRWMDSSYFASIVCLRSHTNALRRRGWQRLKTMDTLRNMTPPATTRYPSLPQPERG